MSSSDLSLTFSDVYKRVSDFLGMGLTPTGADLTKVKDITYRGYRRFLLPMNLRNAKFHAWSYLKQYASVTTQAGEWEFPLPLDFAYFWLMPVWGPETRFVNPQPTSMENILKMRSGDMSNGHPSFWSVNTAKYTVDMGTQYQLALHSPADGAYRLVFGYIMEPNKPTDDAHYFIGGALASEAILEHCLAVAEEQEDDKQSVHDGKAKELTQALIDRDLKLVPVSLGKNLDQIPLMDDPQLARELRYIGPATTAYGVS
jgi:hypothetical protein